MHTARPTRIALGAKALLALALLFALPLALRTAAADEAARPSAPAPTTPATPATPAPGRPRLVLLIVIDQFRADYLERFDAHFGEGGFRRLQRRGCVYRGARYPHATTSTAPGHATIATGGYACKHGITGNDWIDRASGQRLDCDADGAEKDLLPEGVAAEGGGASPRSLRTSTFGDELVIAHPESRVVSVSMKDYAAAIMGGRRGAAYFWKPPAGGFTTSTYYAAKLPGWVAAWNGARPFDAFRKDGWQRLLPEAAYASQGPDDQPWELASAPVGRVFPHPLAGTATGDAEYFKALEDSPFINTLTGDFAATALKALGLGKKPGVTDVLCVSFSSVDYVGHRFGIESHEVLDAIARVDRDIAALLDAVEKEVGLGRTLVALSADHGMASTPEAAAAHGFPSGRLDPADLEKRATAAILRARVPGAWTARFVNPGLYLRNASHDPALPGTAFAASHENAEAAQRAVAAALLEDPGIAHAFCRADILRGAVPATEIGRGVTLAYDAGRSGDVVLVARPYWIMDEGPYDDCASHGSPYGGEQHVPLILLGAGITPGRHDRPVSPADIAPTIARILGLSRPSGAEGEVLLEAIGGAPR